MAAASKLHLSLFCAAAWLVSANAPAQSPIWSQLPGSPSGTSPRHDDIFFINETTGWTARSVGGIYKTTDGGVTWTQKLSQPATHFRCIGFASATRGWAGNLGPGSYDDSVTDTNVLYETFDGGETWTNRPGFVEAGMRGLCSIQVRDPAHIYGVGRVRGPAYFIKSVDGGTNWSLTNLTAAGVMGAMMDVYFKDDLVGFVVGMSTNTFADNCASTYFGRIAKTTDGGQTWTPVATTTIPCCYFWKMSWPTPEIGYASLQKNPTSSDAIVFYKTTDGGNTWVSNGIPVSSIGVNSFYWQGIGFVNANEGWAGGDSSSSPYANNFLHTINGGASWSPAGYLNSQRINRIRFLSPTLGVASGAKLHVFRVPLAIDDQPKSQWVTPGVEVTFTVTASGNPPFSYQWRNHGVDLNGATNAALTLTNVLRSHAGVYSVRVTNAWGTLSSSNASLRVVTPQYLATPQLNGLIRIVFGDADGGSLTTNDLAHLEVQTSSNLLQWLSLTNTLSLTNGMILMEDPLLYPQRFYRVLEH